jgi:hypothetical protein
MGTMAVAEIVRVLDGRPPVHAVHLGTVPEPAGP